MTLQERVLEALGEKALKPQALYTALSGELASAIDFALRGLMKSGIVTLKLGRYQRARLGSHRSLSQTPVSQQPQDARDEQRRCRRCKTWKAVAEFAGDAARICASCKRPSGRPPKNRLSVDAAAAVLAKPKQQITVSARILQALQNRQVELAAAIEAAEADLASKREELLDLVQFLNWIAARTGAS
jgi:hypothetical protein